MGSTPTGSNDRTKKKYANGLPLAENSLYGFFLVKWDFCSIITTGRGSGKLRFPRVGKQAFSRSEKTLETVGF